MFCTAALLNSFHISKHITLYRLDEGLCQPLMHFLLQLVIKCTPSAVAIMNKSSTRSPMVVIRDHEAKFPDRQKFSRLSPAVLLVERDKLKERFAVGMGWQKRTSVSTVKWRNLAGWRRGCGAASYFVSVLAPDQTE